MDITITRQPAHRHNIVLAAFQQNTMRSSPSRRQKLIAQIVLYPPPTQIKSNIATQKYGLRSTWNSTFCCLAWAHFHYLVECGVKKPGITMTMTNHKGALQSDTLRLPKANRPKAVCECKCEPSVAQKSIDHRESLTRVKPLLPRANSSALFSCLAFFF